MKILHTADWHLGMRLNRVDRSDDLGRAIGRVFAHGAREAVDVLLIAGDLFDNVSRADDVCAAIGMLGEAARPFLRGGGTILALAGNHDGETFGKTLQHALGLADPSPHGPGDLLEPGRFHLATRPTFCRLADRSGGQVQFVLMPFPTPDRYLDDAVTPYEGGAEGKRRVLLDQFRDTLARMRSDPRYDPTLHSVLAAHIFLQGATLPGGHVVTERDGIVCPPQDLGAGWAYVALGDIHRPQAVGGLAHVRYSGSIERLDFDERDDDKGVVLVEVGPEGRRGEPAVLPLAATPFHEVVIRRPAEELPTLRDRYPDADRALVKCHVTYTAGVDDYDAIAREIDAIFPRCYQKTIVAAGDERVDRPAGEVGLSGKGLRETVLDYLSGQLDGQPHAEAVLAAADGLIEEVRT